MLDFVVDTHGGTGFIAAVYNTSEDAVKNWINGERNITATRSSTVINAITGKFMWYAKVPTEWFRNNWKTSLNERKSVMVFLSCEAVAGGNDSLFANSGGRVGFAYDSEISSNKQENDMNRLFGRMNGSVNNGTKRSAEEAYDKGKGYTTGFKITGTGWTTLCPATVSVFPQDGDTVGNRKGWGCIIFDTYMDDGPNYKPDKAVTKTSGNCAITSQRWFGNEIGKFGIGFNFDNVNRNGATMRVIAQLCRNKVLAGLNRALDGNGIQPNGDDKQWTFK